MRNSHKLYVHIKTIIDFILSIIGIIFCFGLLWWWIFIINLFATKGRPIFWQERYGKHKKVFKILKFRSMKNDADPYLAPSNISGEQYYNMETKFGRFLRKTSLDETLQLFNILIGQMSFVGPRPGSFKNEDVLVNEREKFKPNAFDVKPGLTGLAQISLKDRHNPSLKAKYDSYYVLHMNLWLDTKIFIRTTFHVVNDDLIKKSK